MKQYLVIDVGGTAIKYSLMDESAVIFEKGEVPTEIEKGLDHYLDTLVSIYKLYEGKVEAICMSAPGKIDANKGFFHTGGALKFISNFDMKTAMEERTGVPFCVENDAKSAALAELWKGSMQGIENGSVITLGTGIGGALIFNGKLYRGSTYAAGEFSGISLRLDLPYSPTRMWATQNGVGRLVEDYAERIGADASTLNGRILFAKANEGDKDALDAIDAFTQGIATGIMSLQTIVDVQRVAIGGGVSKQPMLMESLHKQLHSMYDPYSAFLPATLPEVVSCTFGNDANMIGALYHYLNEVKH